MAGLASAFPAGLPASSCLAQVWEACNKYALKTNWDRAGKHKKAANALTCVCSRKAHLKHGTAQRLPPMAFRSFPHDMLHTLQGITSKLRKVGWARQFSGPPQQ
eukprot:1154802-Pelagomonas_calceolata.AAC.1